MCSRKQNRKSDGNGRFALLLLLLACTADLQASEPTQLAAPEIPDTRLWLCTMCPLHDGWFGVLDFGLGYLNGSSAKYADYRGLDEKGFFPALNGDVHYRDDKDRYLDFYANRLGIDSRSLQARGGQRGNYQLRLSYQEIPKYRGFGTATVYSGAGTSNLTLPDNWQKASTTGGMSALESSLIPTSLETLRKTLAAGLSWKITSRWSTDADVYHETKDGTRPFGAGVFTINTSQFPAPVNFTTNRLDLGVQYSTPTARVRVGFAGSWFDNGTTSLSWENPFNSEPNNDLLRTSLAPDNKFYQFSLQGAFTPRPGLRLSGRVLVGRMRQNDSFLPYTINPAFQDQVLPRPSADLTINTGTLNIAGKLYARLASKLDLSAKVKIDQRDNNSPVDVWNIIITDFLPGGERYNRPYSFEREQYQIELNYRVASAITLRAGANQENHERTLQSVLDTKQRVYWGEIYFKRWSAGQLRVKLETADRKASPYRQVDVTGLIENPLMRKFNYADRNSNRAIIDLQLYPNAIWSINLSYSRAQADYDESLVGLQKSDEQSLTVDAGVSLGRGISLSIYASRDDISSVMSGFDFATQLPWEGLTDDRTTTYGLNLSGKSSSTFSWGLDWMHANSRGQIGVRSTPGDPPFPDLRTRIGNLRGYLNLAITHHWGIKFVLEYESLSTSDWQIDGLGPASISNVLTLGDISPRYYITQVRLQASYRF